MSGRARVWRLRTLAATLAAVVGTLEACVGSRLQGGPPVDPGAAPSEFLGPTPVIDTEHPDIVRVARELTAGAASNREKAVRIHDFVRDRVRFGFQSRFYDVRASEVLAGGVGYCNTKSTLFIALLRASGIPARAHFVDLDSGLLRGVVDPGTPLVDHCYTEVWDGTRWVKTDSYIVDTPLRAAALERLRAEGRRYGYGVHAAGTGEWDGTRDAFSQFVAEPGHATFTRSDFGVHADVLAFYRDTPGAWNRLTPALRAIGPVAFSAANERAERIRRGVER